MFIYISVTLKVKYPVTKTQADKSQGWHMFYLTWHEYTNELNRIPCVSCNFKLKILINNNCSDFIFSSFLHVKLEILRTKTATINPKLSS